MTNQQGEIRIYVACLASYNSGVLHGRWIDACQDVDTIRDEINAMLKASLESGAEEYAIHDYEGFEGARIEEYSSVETIHALAAFIDEHGELGGRIVEYYGDLDDARTALEDHYHGVYQSVSEFAEELTEQTVEIPGPLRHYIDYERMASDLEINDILAIDTGFERVHIFWSH